MKGKTCKLKKVKFRLRVVSNFGDGDCGGHRGKMHCARAVFLLLVNAPLLKTIGKNNKLGFRATNFEKLKLQTSNLRLKNPEQLQYSFICFYTFAPRSFGLAPTAKNIMKVDSLCSHVAIVVALGILINHHSDGNENVEKQ